MNKKQSPNETQQNLWREFCRGMLLEVGAKKWKIPYEEIVAKVRERWFNPALMKGNNEVLVLENHKEIDAEKYGKLCAIKFWKELYPGRLIEESLFSAKYLLFLASLDADDIEDLEQQGNLALEDEFKKWQIKHHKQQKKKDAGEFDVEIETFGEKTHLQWKEIANLKRVEGHLLGIKDMISKFDEGKNDNCRAICDQLRSASTKLRRMALKILGRHLKAHIQEEGDFKELELSYKSMYKLGEELKALKALDRESFSEALFDSLLKASKEILKDQTKNA